LLRTEGSGTLCNESDVFMRSLSFNENTRNKDASAGGNIKRFSAMKKKVPVMMHRHYFRA
jgi:hypothetical protein